MTKVRDIYAYLCELAPLSLQMDYDNAGFLIGRGDAEVTRLLLSLDVTGEVVEEAVRQGAELIVSHHPVIFHAVKSVTDDNWETEKLLKLIENHIAVISMHTNLDIANGGVNDVLLSLFGAKTEGAIDNEGCGRFGTLPAPVPLAEFLPLCKAALNISGLRYYDAGRPVSRLAVMGGSGGDCVERVFAMGCDTYVTADIKYHEFLAARELGLNLIDGDHFCTENPVITDLACKLRDRFPELNCLISAHHNQTARFF